MVRSLFNDFVVQSLLQNIMIVREIESISKHDAKGLFMCSAAKENSNAKEELDLQGRYAQEPQRMSKRSSEIIV